MSWNALRSPGAIRLAARIRSSPLAVRLLHGSLWSLVGSVVSRLLALAAAILAARILGKSVYGEMGIIQNTIMMCAALAGFGMGTTATKFVAEFRERDPARAGRIIALTNLVAGGTSAITAIILVFAAPWISRTALEAPNLTEYLQLGALLMLFTSINGAQIGVLSGFEAFKQVALVSSTVGLLSFPLTVGGALLGGLWGLILGLALAQAAGAVLNYRAIRREVALRRIMVLRPLRRDARVVWTFSVPALLGALVTAPVSWLCGVMLVRQPDGFAHMGTLNAANQWLNALMWLPYMLGGVVLPILSERIGVNDHARSTKLLIASIKINAAVVFPLVIVGSALSPYIMGAYGKDFREEWPTLIVTLMVAGVLAIQIPAWQVIAASGRMWVGLAMNLGWASLYLGATWVLVAWGSLGVAMAQLLAFTVHAAWNLAYAFRVNQKLRASAAVS